MIRSENIENARRRIADHIVRTPVLTSPALDAMCGGRFFFKCESLQRTGSFKARGATNAVLGLRKDLLEKGVATHSSGNHAQAVAMAASIAGVKAHVVMPTTASELKRKGARSYGATVVDCGPGLAAREETLRQVIRETGAVEIHPYNNEAIISGQASAACELFEEVPDLDYVLTPVGGGGLISGTAIAASLFSPKTSVIGGEPAGADDAYRSMKSRKLEVSQADSIADGLLASLGDITLSIILEHVAEIVRVDDSEIIAAMKVLIEKLKIVVEPSAAVPFAALVRTRERFQGSRTGIILSGGNIDLEGINRLLK